jgi:hypothetical protein
MHSERNSRPAPASGLVRAVCAAVLLSAALTAAGCANASVASPSATAAPTSTEYFSGTLTPGAASFYSFSVTNAGTTEVTLASTTTAKIGPAVTLPLRLGIGIPLAEGCSTVRTVDTPSGLSAQLLNASGAGVYCVNVADIGSVSGNLLFTVRITHS